MATGITIASTSNLSSGQRIVVANAKVAFEPAAPDPDLISNQRIGQGEKQYDLLTYARLSQSSALTEGVDLSSVQQLVTASMSITPTEHGTIVTLSKRLVRSQGDTSVIATTGKLIGGSLRRRMANDVIALYDGFSKSTPGASSAIDITTFRGTVAYLLTDNDEAYGPASMPLKAALHIEQISDIILDITDPGTSSTELGSRFGLSADMLQRWWRGSDKLYGIPIFHSGNITIDSGDDAKGAIFAEEALFMVTANNAESTEQPDESARIIEYGLFQEWGEAERADPHGVEIFSDAAATV